MADTKDLFRALDELPEPDIWADVSFAPGSDRLRADLDDRRPPSDPTPRHRAIIALAALAVAIVPLGALWFAFRSESTLKQPGMVPVTIVPIAYSASVEGRWHLFTVEPDGTNATMIPIADLPGDAFHPSWSPDGTRLVFDARVTDSAGTARGGPDLYIVDSDGSNLHRITTSPDWDSLPAWSPDGSSIAYVHGHDGNDDIWVVGSDGSDPHPVNEAPGLDLLPSWSPDGKSLTFASNRAGNPEIYVMASDGSDVQRLTHNSSFDGAPAWSPDGKSIAFASDEDGPGVYVMAADGSGVRKVTDERQVGPIGAHWSPDGSKILFTSGSADGSMTSMSIVDVASGRVTPLVGAEELCCPTWQAGRLPAVTSTPEPPPTGGSTDPPILQSGSGWQTISTGDHLDDESYPLTWATNGMFDARDLESVVGGAFTTSQAPYYSLPLDSGQILIVAGLVNPAGTPPADSPTFPPRDLPLDLHDADVEREWEGQPSARMCRYVLRSAVNERYVELHVYFGGGCPNEDTLAKAQDEVATLIVPTSDRTAVGEDVVVPDLIGLSFVDARAELEALGLGMHFQVYTGGYIDEAVLKQHPSAGSSVSAHSIVNLVIGPRGAR